MKEPLISDEWTHQGSRKRKDTKRWCKGKVGREHVPVIELNRRFMIYRDKSDMTQCKGSGWLACIHHEVCSTCHKELKWAVDYCPDTGWRREKK